jgi:hypothetical protein
MCVFHTLLNEGLALANIGFIEVFEALSQGKQVRQARWEKDRVLVVRDGLLVQLLKGKFVMLYQLDWREMNRKDWRIVE